MRVHGVRFFNFPEALIVFISVVLGVVPYSASAQGLAVKSAYSRLLPLAAEDTLAAAAARESNVVVSLDDVAWLYSALITVAKNPGQKKILLTENARLLELLGRLGEAATAWELAASTLPGIPDVTCLTSAAVCRLAAGESESAARLADSVVTLSPDVRTNQLSQLVSGWVALAKGERSVSADIARIILSGSDAGFTVAALQLGSAATEGVEHEAYEKRLSTFANRPEVTSTIPLLLFGGSSRTVTRMKEEIVQPVQEPQAEMSFYQVGAFRDEANAKLMVKKLEGLNLEPVLTFKSEKKLYCVYVRAGTDTSRTVLVLKDAGLEAWAIDGPP